MMQRLPKAFVERLQRLIRRPEPRQRVQQLLQGAASATWTATSLLGSDLRVPQPFHVTDPDKDDGWIAVLLDASRCFFDIGCNVGHLALLAALDHCRDVVAVDANADALCRAAEVVCRNGVSARVRFVPGFVGARDDETVQFWTVGTGAAGSAYASHAVTASRRQANRLVRTFTLDTLASMTGLSPDFVKVDVEGAEAEVLAGARGLVADSHPRFLVEMHSCPELPMVANARLVLDWCERVEYEAWYLRNHAPLTDPAQLADRGRCHLILQQRGMEYPRGLEQVPESCGIERALELTATARQAARHAAE